MNLERLGRGNKVGVAVGVVVLLAVVGGAYLAFADRTVEISNAEELQDMKNDLDANYVLVSDIDASEIENFEPIGNSEKPFTGSFDGNGHTISNLMINRPKEWEVGLFSRVEGGSIRNIGIEDVNVSGRRVVGGIVGVNEGEVHESYVTGKISGDSVVGGVVGLTLYNGGDSGVVVDSYAESDVSGNEVVGGIVGQNNGEVVRSYAVGEVTGNVDVGGLIGYDGDGAGNSYWNINSTGQEISAGGTGLTTDEMTGSAAHESMDGFDFEDTWETVTDPDDYPRLAWQSETDK